ncbi:MAG: hypothetical protein U1A23_00105 [Candidatus Sungbacteria bacterium]|nr:hypothetical protein [bacterium]MDZ4285312.1 hypothetical protein [Candidatus Sungbacteria bacterium]
MSKLPIGYIEKFSRRVLPVVLLCRRCLKGKHWKSVLSVASAVLIILLAYYPFHPSINVLPDEVYRNEDNRDLDLIIKKNQPIITLTNIAVSSEYFLVPAKSRSGEILVCPIKSNYIPIFTKRFLLGSRTSFPVDIQDYYPRLKKIIHEAFADRNVVALLRVSISFSKILDNTQHRFDKVYIIFDENMLVAFDQYSILRSVFQTDSDGRLQGDVTPEAILNAIKQSSTNPKIECPALNLNEGKWEMPKI